MSARKFQPAELFLGSDGKLYFKAGRGRARNLTPLEIDPNVAEGVSLSELADEVTAQLRPALATELEMTELTVEEPRTITPALLRVAIEAVIAEQA